MNRTTARFELQRRKILKKVFSVKKLVRTWRDVVRAQMRSLDICDLHDYYDFNLNIEEKCQVLHQQIVDGQYRVCAPMVFRAEKKFGISRHLMLPSPADAV